MEYQKNEPKDVIGVAHLMANNNDFDITALENEVIRGADHLIQEEEDVTNQYKEEMERLTTSFNISDFNDDLKNEGGYGGAGGNDSYDYSAGYGGSNNYGGDQNFSYNDTEDQQLKYMTMEQKKQNYVNEVLHDIDTDENLEFDIDKEKDEDDKNALLEQIDILRDTLEDDGINLANVPHVTKSNSLSDITNVYKILQLKNDRNRYCSFAEELILSGAYGLEYLFDGQKEWFGRKPDLVGWSSTVRIKLRRCRFQTSTLVKDMMQNYNMGPGFQLLLELIPSLFLYSRAKKSVNTASNDDLRYDEAISNLNDSFDSRR